MRKKIRIGTRGSALALIQAEMVKSALLSSPSFMAKDTDIEIVSIRTAGDWRPEHQEKTFLEMGGSKGLFTCEIENALEGELIDIAVHSMKDVSVLPLSRLVFSAFLPREDPRDAFISPLASCPAELPEGARVGTSSLRRGAQMKAFRPDLNIVPLRGNVDTRLAKLASGQVDATILAAAGLKRLLCSAQISSFLESDFMLPAAGQGILGVQTRFQDHEMHELLSLINCPVTEKIILAERSFMREIDGSCRTPIAGFAEIVDSDRLRMRGLVASIDGSEVFKSEAFGAASDAEWLGEKVASDLKKQLPSDFF